MSVSVAELVAQVRIDSGLRNNQVWSDDQICGALTDGYHDLRDRMIVKFWQWFRKTHDFALTGGNDGNTLNLADEVPDLEMIKGLDFVDSGGNHFTVDMMDSFANRNAYNTVWPFGGSWGFNGQMGRRYYPDGDLLIIAPPSNAAGDYQLIYTPQAETLALPVEIRSFNANAFDTPLASVGPSSLPGWSMANGNFTSADVGRVFTPSLDNPNQVWNVPFTITAIISSTVVNVTPNPTLLGSFTLPSVGSYLLTGQPASTIGSLPTQLTPWKKYITLFASKVIRASRRQPADDLEMQFKEIDARVSAVTKQRSEGVKQAPIVRGMFGGGWGRGGVG